MAHHLSIYKYTGTGAAFSNADAPAVADPTITLLNGHPIFPQQVNLVAAYVFGQTDLTDALVTTPKLRTIQIPHIRPLDIVTAPSNRPYLPNYRKHPLSLTAVEEIAVQLSGATGTLNNTYNAGLWFQLDQTPAPMGDVFTARATAAITTVTQGWAGGVLTFDNPLPSGTYSVIGMDVWGTNLAFARLIFPSQIWRPGCIAGQVAGYIGPPCFRLGEIGEFGRFVNFAQPQLEVFALGAGSAQTAFLDLVKIG